MNPNLKGFWNPKHDPSNKQKESNVTRIKPKKVRGQPRNPNRENHNYGAPVWNTLREACLAELDLPSNTPNKVLAAALEGDATKQTAKKPRRVIERHGKRILRGDQPRTCNPDKGFYKSEAWLQLRYLALKNCEGKCQACGISAKDGASIHVDHIKPRTLYPELALSIDNLNVLCADCNYGKGVWDETDWR